MFEHSTNMDDRPELDIDEEEVIKKIAERRFSSQTDLLRALDWTRRKTHVFDGLENKGLIKIDRRRKYHGIIYSLTEKGTELAREKRYLIFGEWASSGRQAEIERIVSRYWEVTPLVVESEFGDPIQRDELLRAAKNCSARIGDRVIPRLKFAGLRPPEEYEEDWRNASAYW